MTLTRVTHIIPGALISVALVCIGCESSSARAQQANAPSERTDAQTASNPATDVSPLDAHAWKHRPVIIFAPSPSDQTYRQQASLFEDHRNGIEDRDIVIYRVFPDAGTGPDGALTPAAREALRARFSPDPPFTVILVGKDTTEKLRRDQLLDIDTLFSTIDAMPMRQREMKRQDD